MSLNGTKINTINGCAKRNLSNPKNLNSKMEAKYNPTLVEKHWNTFWEQNGFYTAQKPLQIVQSFKPKAEKEAAQDKMIMIIPPPNVTGKLHIGHALMCTVQDTIIRWARMSGKETLWVPGVDHAGIATQNVVERQLRKTRNLSRFDLGREKFEEEVWKWKKEYGSQICEQIKRMGSSVDWNRSFFTLSKELSKSVNEAFMRLYEKGKIYRAKRFVNWSCALTTAIADCEVNKTELPKRTLVQVPGHSRKVEFGVIHKFSYKFVDSEEEILIETTRPETMLGDVAVAVHPKDGRYKHFIGRNLKHPFVDRVIPIVGDSKLVDMEKGTGVVKITPAHDENDFESGERNGLRSIAVFGRDGRMNQNGGAYEGMMRFDCRFRVVKDLEKLGQYYGKRDFSQVLCQCSRSNDVIEPIITSQWWLDCEEVAAKSCKAVRDGELKITPKREEKTFFSFLENIRPWCISRQLWWGHRIPAYLPVVSGKTLDGEKTEDWIIAPDFESAEKTARRKYGETFQKLVQDQDVLDTWFSSALLPFSVFGWPDQSADLQKYYPNSILETGSDILFFWVARMVFMSLELNQVLPFKEVLLHPIVRAADGSKMSKSKGNIIDPLEVIDGATLQNFLKRLDESSLSEKQIEKYKKLKRKEFPEGIPVCGADALRFGLLCQMNTGNSINLDVSRVNGYRMFCNKIWQTANYAFPKLELHESDLVDSSKAAFGGEGKEEYLKERELSLADRWILTRLCRAEKAVKKAFENFELNTAAQSCYDFWLKELCDIYLELTKPVFGQSGATSKQSSVAAKVLYFVLHRALRMFHPLMPFITEELFQRLPGDCGSPSVMVSPFPAPSEHCVFEEVEEQMELALKVVRTIRSARMMFELGNSKLPLALIQSTNKEKIGQLLETISVLAKIQTLNLVDNDFNGDQKYAQKRFSRDPVDADITVHIELNEKVNINAQMEKLSKRSSNLQKQLNSLNKKISQNQKSNKIPEEIKKSIVQKKNAKSLELEKIEACYKHLKTLEKV